jgi:hypothetical protein
MRVLDSECFAVYIYDDEHPPPHCHLIFNNGDEVVVGLPMLDAWYGKALKKRVRKVLEENLDQLADAWDSKHPQRN